MFFIILNDKYLLFRKLITMYHINMNITLSENSDNDKNNDSQRGVVLEAKPKTKKPSMYNVLLLNDDYTPMEFVIIVLAKIFNKKQEEATQIMLHVHKKGVGVCGTFTYEVAESKCKSVMDMAKKNEHPLQCSMEKS
jgi:ATP-dependent Clp protease adaptor protein ClpS